MDPYEFTEFRQTRQKLASRQFLLLSDVRMTLCVCCVQVVQHRKRLPMYVLHMFCLPTSDTEFHKISFAEQRGKKEKIICRPATRVPSRREMPKSIDLYSRFHSLMTPFKFVAPRLSCRPCDFCHDNRAACEREHVQQPAFASALLSRA